MRQLGAAFTVLFLITACEPPPTAFELPPPSEAISDGAHQGNDNFFFLPPMVPDPSPSGTVDTSLEPEVEICVWNGSDCDDMLAVFNVNTGPGSEAVRVEDDHYIVNWHTEDIIDNYPLDVGETYRIRVIVAGRLLGFADVAVVGGGKDLKNVNTDEFIPLLAGRTLPIKFRIEIGALTDATIMSAGQSHSCALAPDGQAYCWGRNEFGALGNGTVGGPGPGNSINTPQAVTGGHTFESIHANTHYTCGLTTDGQAYCWGRNQLGQLGIGTSDFLNHPVPEPVAGGRTFVSMNLNITNRSHACALTAAGALYCWGFNNHGQVGTGTATFAEPTPVLVSGHTFEGQPAPGREYTCARTTSGEALCWGANPRGNLGNGVIDGNDYLTPAPVLGGHTFSSLRSGLRHTCGLNTSGKAICWGLNNRGQLGDGTWTDNATPQFVVGGHSFNRLGAGLRVVCGIRTDGETLCWGRNGFGQLGRGFAETADFSLALPPPLGEPVPGLVVGGLKFKDVDSGSGWTCGQTIDDEVYCWGRNSAGYLGDGTFVNNVVPQLVIDLDP